jgi:hypothetical protein
VYVEGANTAALLDTTEKLHQLIQETRTRIGTRVDIIMVLTGDFNRHDQLWGGIDVSRERQGEADPIIDLMSDHALQNLLPRGTKTWQQGNRESTIDLVLASEELATSVVKCTIHTTERGSDHRAIESTMIFSNPFLSMWPNLVSAISPKVPVYHRRSLLVANALDNSRPS